MIRILCRPLSLQKSSTLKYLPRPSVQNNSIFILRNEFVRQNTTKVEIPKDLKSEVETIKTEVPKTPEVKYQPVNRWEGSWHWYGERGLSILLVPMFGISGVYGGHPFNDFLLGFLVPIHTHIGLSAVVTDYFPRRRVPKINRLVTGTQLVLTVGTMYGCYIINTEDIGLTEYVKKIWTA